MDFILVVKFILERFIAEKINFAFVGGFALQAQGVVRTTMDVDLLILSSDAEKIKNIMLASGYKIIHESEDVLNFAGSKLELGRVDFLLAHRKYTLAMLERAEERPVFNGKFKIKTVNVNDLIGLKVQSSSNDPQRFEQDMADIKSLVRNNYAKIDKGLLKEYFALFDRQGELEDLLKEHGNA